LDASLRIEYCSSFACFDLGFVPNNREGCSLLSPAHGSLEQNTKDSGLQAAFIK